MAKPTPVFWPGELHGLYSPWGRKESKSQTQLRDFHSRYYFRGKFADGGSPWGPTQVVSQIPAQFGATKPGDQTWFWLPCIPPGPGASHRRQGHKLSQVCHHDYEPAALSLFPTCERNNSSSRLPG